MEGNGISKFLWMIVAIALFFALTQCRKSANPTDVAMIIKKSYNQIQLEAAKGNHDHPMMTFWAVIDNLEEKEKEIVWKNFHLIDCDEFETMAVSHGALPFITVRAGDEIMIVIQRNGLIVTKKIAEINHSQPVK